VTPSPVEQLLAAVDRLDIDGVMALLAPDARISTADGRRAIGAGPVRELLTSFTAQVRSTAHHITAQWHQDDTWIAEIDASYEMRDYLRLESLPRAIVVRTDTTGILDIRVYGAHEHALTEERDGEEGLWVGGRWIPPL
jgi:hypothetical protein